MTVPIPSASSSESRFEVSTIVVAGGGGSRFGGPKQFVELAGLSVLERAVVVARSVSDRVVVVVPAGSEHEVEGIGDVVVVAGGESRSDSVRKGLAAVPASSSIILIHDAARPLASVELFGRVVDAVVSGADAVVPGIAVTDTIRRRTGGIVDREGIVAVQTPQGFTAQAIRAGHASGEDATDDATLVERAGITITLIEGEPQNIKITTPQDLSIASGWIEGTRE